MSNAERSPREDDTISEVTPVTHAVQENPSSRTRRAPGNDPQRSRGTAKGKTEASMTQFLTRSTQPPPAASSNRPGPGAASRSSPHGQGTPPASPQQPSPRRSNSPASAQSVIPVNAISISRCTASTDKFHPQFFYLTPPSPREPIKCDCGIRFVMETYASDLFSILRHEPIEVSSVDDDEGQLHCTQSSVCDLMQHSSVDTAVNTVLSFVSPDYFNPSALTERELSEIAAGIASEKEVIVRVNTQQSQRIAAAANQKKTEQ